MRNVNWLLLGLLIVSQVGNAQSKKKYSMELDGSAIESMTPEQVKALQDICGNNLACYFSADEVAQAFGGKMAAEAGLADLLRMTDGAKYAAEDANVYAEVQAAEERAAARKAQAKLEEAANAASQFIGDLPARQQGATAENKVEVKTAKEAAKAGNKVEVKLVDKDKKEVKKAEAKKESGPLKISGIQARGFPIYTSFVPRFRACAPGCFPHVVSVNRPRTHSCHDRGRAIDVGAIICGGVKYEAIAEANRAGRFTQFKDCMAGKMKTLWHNQAYSEGTKTSGHWDHAHFSNGCTLAGGQRYY